MKGTLESEASEVDQKRKETPQAILSELEDTVNSLNRRADQQQLGLIMQGSSSSPSSHYLPDVLSTFRESVPSQEEAVDATHLALVDPLLNTGEQQPPEGALGANEQAAQGLDPADLTNQEASRPQLDEGPV